MITVHTHTRHSVVSAVLTSCLCVCVGSGPGARKAGHMWSEGRPVHVGLCVSAGDPTSQSPQCKGEPILVSLLLRERSPPGQH